MYRIKNTADDRTKVQLHRTASRFELEPQLGGRRIRLRSHLDITDEHYEKTKTVIDDWVRKGIVEVIKLEGEGPLARPVSVDADGLKLGGPTFEQFLKAGYSAEDYPPPGYAEVMSEGLRNYRIKKEAAEQVPDTTNEQKLSGAVHELEREKREEVKKAAESAESIIPPAQEGENPNSSVATPNASETHAPARTPAPQENTHPPGDEHKHDKKKNKKLY